MRAKFVHPEGDHFTLLAVLKAFLEVPAKQQATWCSDNFVQIRYVHVTKQNWVQAGRCVNALVASCCAAGLRGLHLLLNPHALHCPPQVHPQGPRHLPPARGHPDSAGPSPGLLRQGPRAAATCPGVWPVPTCRPAPGGWHLQGAGHRSGGEPPP